MNATDAQNRALREVLSAPTLDVLKLRAIARLGLPAEARSLVWPILLGISKHDLEQDEKTLQEFMIVHQRGKEMMSNYRADVATYLKRKRILDERAKRKLQQNLAKENETLMGDYEDNITRDDVLQSANSQSKDGTGSEPILSESNNTSSLSNASSSTSTDDDYSQEDSLSDVESQLEVQKPPTLPTSYWDQITKDVERSLWRQVENAEEREIKRDQLHRIIAAVICTAKDEQGKELHYFQGYHDIATVLLIACGESLAFSLLKRISVTYIRDHMRPNMDYILHQLRVLFPLVSAIDSKLGMFLKKSEVQPFVALPWVMTWFSHVVEDQGLSERLFDLFLASPPWMPLYLSASLVLYMTSHGLYAVPCEFSEVHNFMSKFLSQHANVPFEQLIKDSIRLYGVFPPSSIRAEASLPKDSCVVSYPYDWVPKNELICAPSWHITKKYSIAIGLAAVSVVAVAAAVYYSRNQNYKNLLKSWH